MMYDNLLGRHIDAVGRALAHFRRGSELMYALGNGREFFCGGLRALFTTRAPIVRGARTPKVILEGIRHALGVLRTLPRIAKNAARAETAALRVFNATYGYPAKHSFAQETLSGQRPESVKADPKVAGIGPFVRSH